MNDRTKQILLYNWGAKYTKIIDNLKNELIKSYNLNDIKIINPVNPTKIVCVGLNYKDHAKEMNLDLPLEPKIFIKPSTCVIGNNDKIIYPKNIKKIKRNSLHL